MNKKKLVKKLDKVTDKATVTAIQSGVPLAISKKNVLIGNLIVEKKDEFYDILDFNKTVLFNNISGFDVAVIVAQRYNAREFSVVREVLDLEHKFSKFRLDMMHYLHCMKTARKKDGDRLAILEDKFQSAELYANKIKDEIASFKRLK